MTIETGQKVKHKLTGELMLVTHTGLIGVRLPNLETAIVSEGEVEIVETEAE